MPKRLVSLLFMLLPLLLAAAPERATLSAQLNYPALPPGQRAVVALTLSIAPSLHTQAHDVPKPYIPLSITPNPAPGITFLPVQYPPGQSVEYPALGKLSVYTGAVTFYLPFELSPTAQDNADLEIAGTLRYQACDDRTCFPPKTLPFSVKTRIVPAAQAAAPVTSPLFDGFDPRVFAAPSGPSALQGVQVQFFSWSFQLGQSSYLLAMLLAFLVGILFNLMPCVLPVLPLKAIGFYEVSQHRRSRSLLLGALFSLGLVAAFAILATLVVVYQVAWGSQFSKPWFVWTMVAILCLFALGMFGAFTVLLPQRVYKFAPSHETLGGNFLFGAFTALLSTPCTAPMFVVLLAWAGQQPRWLAIATVLMVGIGMAAPYFVLSALPELARKLPRSGPWSNLVKQCMAFLILAVAAYFAAGQLIHGMHFIWAVFAVMLAGALFLVIRAFMLSANTRPRLIATLISLLVAAGAYSFARSLTAADAIPWQPYSADTFSALRSEGRPVMLEFTANWCTNCTTLEVTVLRNPRVAQTLARYNISPVRADLSHEDAPGWSKLQEISPSGGIPLTVIYSPRHPPIHLSSLYTADQLIAALTKAAG